MELTKDQYEELVAQYGKIYVCTVEGSDFAARSMKKSELMQITKLSEMKKDPEILALMCKVIVIPERAEFEKQLGEDGILFPSVISFLTEKMRESKVAVTKNF